MERRAELLADRILSFVKPISRRRYAGPSLIRRAIGLSKKGITIKVVFPSI